MTAGVLHIRCIGNKMVYRRKSCGESEGDCAVSKFHHVYHTHSDGACSTRANHDSMMERTVVKRIIRKVTLPILISRCNKRM